MSLIVLYYLHSTSVLPIYIDVVLTLSILTEINTNLKFGINFPFHSDHTLLSLILPLSYKGIARGGERVFHHGCCQHDHDPSQISEDFPAQEITRKIDHPNRCIFLYFCTRKSHHCFSNRVQQMLSMENIMIQRLYRLTHERVRSCT